MIKAAIFDLDGTLIDSEMLWVESLWLCLGDMGASISIGEATDIVYGRSWIAICEDLRARFPELDIDIDALEKEMSVRMMRLQRERETIVIGGSVRLLKALSVSMPVCIVSGSPVGDIERALDLLNIHADIDFFLGASDYPIGKPDPSGFLMAAERMGIPPAECVVFEDSTAGVRAAKNAGMICVALSRPAAPPQDVSAADLIIEDLGNLDIDALNALAV